MNNPFYELLNISNKMSLEITWPTELSWSEQYDKIFMQIENKYALSMNKLYFYVKKEDTLLTHVINTHEEYKRRITYIMIHNYYVFYITQMEVNAFNTILVHAVGGKDIQINYDELVDYFRKELIL